MLALVAISFVGFSSFALAQESLCAEVQIQIRQELTLERQGFEALMKIGNQLETSISNISITLEFTDENDDVVFHTFDPNSTSELFFVREDFLVNIDNVTNGVIAPTNTAEIQWLIIPNPGAGGSDPQGEIYFVGASLTYDVLDDSHDTDVSPDYIFVRPMPDLVLDYFLPGNVYGDDAFSEEIEPSIPFPLGLRIKNVGYGNAHNLKVDSGQPKIIENDQGLLVGFNIEGSEVHGSTVSDSLLVNFGTLASMDSKMASWIMTVSLSGSFTNFNATISHADDLGGRLTSLIDETNVNAHIHIKDVVVDLAGRDTVKDFLAGDMTLYESEGIDTAVTNMSAESGLSGGSSTYTLTVTNAPATGCVYTKLPNPESTDKILKTVTRSDGKSIRTDNAWLSQNRDGGDPPDWEYWFNLFDANVSSNTYTVVFEDAANENQAPVLAYIGGKMGYAGTNVGFAVFASDDGGSPSLTASPLPAGAVFTDNGDGTGIFSWTPSAYQVGTFNIKFKASDGTLSDSETVTFEVDGDTPPAFPMWWLSQGVIDTNLAASDYAAANMGQLRQFASKAYETLTNLPGGAGFALSFTNDFDYVAVNLGQLKSLATNFYDRLSMTYPWVGAADTNDYAIANIGQVKYVFDFDATSDGDVDGMPDWWENKYSLDPNDSADADDDGDTDGKSNLSEFFQNTDPTVSD